MTFQCHSRSLETRRSDIRHRVVASWHKHNTIRHVMEICHVAMDTCGWTDGWMDG